MLADPRSEEFVRNFVGQWLQARDIETVLDQRAAVIARDEPPDPEAERRRARFRELIRKPPEELTDAEKKELQAARRTFGRSFRRFREFELTGDLRQAMRRETEMLFEHVVREDRSLLELLDSDYTFLNERLAKHYGIEGVKGDEMRRVELPAGQPARRRADAGDGARRHLEPRPDLAGEAGPVHPRQHPRHAPAAAAAGHPVAGGGRQKRSRGRHADPAGVAGRCTAASPLCSSCHDRMDPLGPGPGELQRAGPLARQGARPADRRLREADHRRGVQRRPRAEAHPGRTSTAATSTAA